MRFMQHKCIYYIRSRASRSSVKLTLNGVKLCCPNSRHADTACPWPCRQTAVMVARGRTQTKPVNNLLHNIMTAGPVFPAVLMRAARNSVLNYGPYLETHVLQLTIDGKRLLFKKTRSGARRELEINKRLPTTRMFASRMYGMIEVIHGPCSCSKRARLWRSLRWRRLQVI